MKSRYLSLMLAAVLLFAACAKSPAAPAWQEQYDLGVRYLSEGNYQEAIIAFTAAIEIDPKQAEAYTKLADAYIAIGDTDSAMDILRQGYETTRDEGLAARLEELPFESDGTVGDSLFEQRQEYVAFEALTARQQELVVEVANATTAGDTATLSAIATSQSENREFHENFHLNSGGGYTIWNGYKMNIWINADRDVQRLHVEMRPKDGMGYYARASLEHDERTYTVRASCPCIDWQWNGEMMIQSWKTDRDLYTKDLTESGMMCNSLREGEFTQTVHEAFLGENRGLYYTYINVSTYHDGNILEYRSSLYEDGEMTKEWNGVTNPADVYSLCGGISGNDVEGIRNSLIW